MAPKVGTVNNPNGRPKGSLNKRSQEVQDKLAELNCDPIEGLALVAMEPSNELSLRVTCLKELAQYVAPKLKAMEVTNNNTAYEDLITRLARATSE